MMRPSCAHRESSASFAASGVKTQAKKPMSSAYPRPSEAGPGPPAPTPPAPLAARIVNEEFSPL